MERIITVDLLEDWDEKSLTDLIDILNANHIVSDEDKTCLSSTMIESWKGECDSFLKRNGYLGEKLLSCGGFFDNVGAVYALYDESCISYNEAREYLNKVASRECPAEPAAESLDS